jgi:hypothetical protein
MLSLYGPTYGGLLCLSHREILRVGRSYLALHRLEQLILLTSGKLIEH